MHDVSGQAKVTDLHDFPLRQEDIASGQVPVDTLRRKGRNDGECQSTCARQHHPCKTGHFTGALGAAWHTASGRLSWHKELPSLRLSSQSLPRGTMLWRKVDT